MIVSVFPNQKNLIFMSWNETGKLSQVKNVHALLHAEKQKHFMWICLFLITSKALVAT